MKDSCVSINKPEETSQKETKSDRNIVIFVCTILTLLLISVYLEIAYLILKLPNKVFENQYFVFGIIAVTVLALIVTIYKKRSKS